MTSLRADPTSGAMRGARQMASPNCDARPPGMVPELIVVHGISLPPGEFGGPWIDRLFTNTLPADEHPYFDEIAGLTVSSHLCIARGGTVTQYVSFNDRAWHAGVSSYEGRSACNDFSIGIELEGTDTTPYTDAQYESLAALIGALLSTYHTLSAERVAGHSDIAPGRKTDPGLVFEWARFRHLLAEHRQATEKVQ
jgi:N-acetyl-anhydromuramoyl-L-alanine amidase